MEQIRSYLENHIHPGNVLMDLVYTIIISTVIAAFLTIIGISGSFFINLVMSQSFGISICSIIMLLFWLSKPKNIVSLIFMVIIGIATGTMIGLQIGPFVLHRIFSIAPKIQEKNLLQTIVLAITFGSVISYFFYSKAILRVSNELIQQERIRRLSSEKETLEANLKLLQAQIEPHFLFNTLSNVLSLIDTNPADGKAMLVDLIHYLRTSLSRTFPETVTMNQEMDSIRAYLSIQKIRMRERLRFRIELPEALRDQIFPPMLIQPLVENAIKHGIEPTMEGGEIIIKIEEKKEFIKVEVMDTGIGFSSYHKVGTGLGNVRERIGLLYEGKGRLIIEQNQPSGVKAIIEVPKHHVQGYNC